MDAHDKRRDPLSRYRRRPGSRGNLAGRLAVPWVVAGHVSRVTGHGATQQADGLWWPGEDGLPARAVFYSAAARRDFRERPCSSVSGVSGTPHAALRRGSEARGPSFAAIGGGCS